jgi:hypothetical protein
MKKTSRPARKKPAQKKPAAKQSSTKPKRKAEGQPELAQVVDPLDSIMDKLTELLGRVANPATQSPHAQKAPPRDAQLTMKRHKGLPRLQQGRVRIP